MKTLYPEVKHFHSLMLDTGSPHQVYVEECGNPDGIPVIFLHGGPCSGIKPDHRRYFNPEHYRIILFDQRGCGQSLPFGEIDGNTTHDLIDDMERIRNSLHIDKWLLFGGSWGAALALLYAQRHTDKVIGMILRGTFLARQEDMDWFAGHGVNRIYPEQWQLMQDAAAHFSALSLLSALWQGINDDDQVLALSVAKAWQSWNGQVALGKLFQCCQEPVENPVDTIKQVKMELHFALQNYFIEENQILNNCWRLANTPAVIIHGRNDLVCPLASGLQLHKALPGSKWIVLPNAGHIAQHEEMVDALVRATDDFVNLIKP
jgi:proline iminopeptidase